MSVLHLEPCPDCGDSPRITDNGDSPSDRVVKWYRCACGRKASRGCGTRAEAAKKWNAMARFVWSFRAGRASRASGKDGAEP